MKKTILLLYCLFFISQFSYGQYEQDDWTVRMSLGTDKMMFTNDNLFTTYGLNLEFKLTQWISIGYHFSIGNTNENRACGHTTLGTVWAAQLLQSGSRTSTSSGTTTRSSNSGLGYIGLLLFILPESIQVHIPLAKNFRLTPFIVPLGCEYEKLENVEKYYASLSGGFKFNVLYKNMHLSPYASVTKLYETGEKGLGLKAGILVGINF